MRKFMFIMILAVALEFSTVANATLWDRGGGLIYDDDLNITWLSDANYAGTSMNWDLALNWADNLTYYDSVRDIEWDDWRLPTAIDENGNTPTDREARDTELGHLFYDELGGTLWNPISASGDPDLALFTNIQNSAYWSSTFYGNYGDDYAWVTYFSSGFTREYGENAPFYAWAVRDGDVGTAPVPEPLTIFLLGAGLAGITGFRKKLKR